MLGGMFKRKDKKSKIQEKENEDAGKTSSDLSRQSPQPQESQESLSLSQEAQASKPTPSVHRQAGKLQKAPPTKVSPKSTYSQSQRDIIGTRPNDADQQSSIAPEPSRAPPLASEPNGSMRIVQPESSPGLVTEVTEETAPVLNLEPAPLTTREEPIQVESPKDSRRGVFSPIKDALMSSPSEPKPEKVQKAKQRMHIDDFDSSSDDEEQHTEPSSERGSHEEPESHLEIAQNAQYEYHEPQTPIAYSEPPRERLSESPIEVSAPPQEDQRTTQPPPLMVDTSSQEDRSASPVSPLSSPELIEAPQERSPREETPASTAHSSTPTWSDASLRAYLEDDNDIKDLLVVVHDKSDVKPARKDHPIVKNMYREENQRLSKLSNQLDGLLGDYLARKGRTAPVR